jgi:peptide/nickel transport system ATP-binding protein
VNSTPLLEVDALNVVIGRTPIIKNLSLTVGTGEILGLVGASGSGKSMTALAIMRLLPSGAGLTGTVRLRGEAFTTRSERAMQKIRGREIGMVFQEPMTALNPLMTIGAQVAETLRLHGGMSMAQSLDKAREVLDTVGLPASQADLERLPYELSGGQRQRVAIAMAIAMAPSLLIADEPTTALDVITQAQILGLLETLAHARHMGLLLVTHDLAVLAQLADRVAVMHQGEIVEQGTTVEILRQAHHPYTRALLAAAKLKPKRVVVADAADARAVAVLEVSGIVRDYPRRRSSLWRATPPLRAVDGASLRVFAGETVGLVGESGSGKSSLLKVILALEACQQGQVRLLGQGFSSGEGSPARAQRRAIQVVFQDPFGSFDPRWSVERLIAEPFYLLDAPPNAAQRSRRVAAVLEQVGLEAGDARRLPHEFSGGQRQRIAIARALVTGPAVIAFDEAVSALDVIIREQILDLLAELAVRLNLACLFVSHDLHVIRAIADRVYVMQQGRIVEEGITEAVFGSPQHAYTRALIAATPRLPAARASI